MSSDEDFSLVGEKPEETLEGIQDLITSYKKKHDQLVEEQRELIIARDDAHEMTKKCRERSEKLSQDLNGEKISNKQKIEDEKLKLDALKVEELELMKEIQRVEAVLKEEEAENKHLKEQTDVFTAVPEKKVVFTGETTKAANAQMFEMKPRIVYPMEEGTALITFEEEVVAKKILSMQKHQVDLAADCSITVEARPVQLILPRLVEIDSEVCPQCILISNLPKMDTDTLLNKLEIHFSKRKHGGGEVDNCEMLPDSGTVVLKFVEKNSEQLRLRSHYHTVSKHITSATFTPPVLTTPECLNA